MLVLAGAATVIASQAVITGAFSLTQQAIQLGLLPRMTILRTSEHQAGQIFLPQINALLLVGVLILVVLFRSSDNLAHAYGLAVTGTMIVTTSLAFIVVRYMWNWRLWVSVAFISPFLVLDTTFLAANALKVLSGEAGCSCLMTRLSVRGDGHLGARARALSSPKRPAAKASPCWS